MAMKQQENYRDFRREQQQYYQQRQQQARQYRYQAMLTPEEREARRTGREEARRLRDNYTRRLMYHFPGARILIYMGRGKGTHRIHFHMVSEGIPEDMITKLWGMGEIVRIEHLREHNYYSGIDHGQDYTGLANYLFDHWTPEQGGHRWKKAGKLDKPDREPSTEVKRNYTENKPPRPPKGYILVESKATKYGYLYYKYVRQPEPPKKSRRKKAGSG